MFETQFFSVPVPSCSGLAPADHYQRMMWEAQQQIQRGLQTQFAGTGYPINMLWGGAHTSAVLAAIGGGAISEGGCGVYGGLQILLQYAWASGAYYEAQRRLPPQWWQQNAAVKVSLTVAFLLFFSITNTKKETVSTGLILSERN